MKNEFYLSPKGRQEVSATGQYIGYVSGAGEIEVNINGEHHYLNVNEVLQVNETFNSFAVTNMSDFAGEFVIKAGMGRLIMAGDGQLTDVLRVRETVKTDVLNHDDISNPIVSALAQALTANIANTSDISTPIVSKITDLIGSVINIRAITETLKTHVLNTVDIRQITETLNIRTITETLNTKIAGLVSTQEKAATSIETTEKTFSAGESFTIPANTNRRDITIFAAETNSGLVTVVGIPLAAGQYVELKNYVGSIGTTAAADDKILITEVIK